MWLPLSWLYINGKLYMVSRSAPLELAFIDLERPTLMSIMSNINRKPYMGSPMAPSHLTLSDIESSKSRSLRFWSLISCTGDELGHTLLLTPGHTALYGLITAKPRQKFVSREADDIVRIDVEFKTSYSWFLDVAGREEIFFGMVSDTVKSFEMLKTFYRVRPRTAHVLKTYNTLKHTW